jgi:alpha-1,6-mannosyltransferase
MSPTPASSERTRHVVDATMFWSATGGGVRRYLLAKQAWLARQPGWSHTLAVPLAGAPDAGTAKLPALPLPFSGGYRLPLRRRAVADRLVALRPDLVEAGDPYVVAWAALDAARRCGIPALAYCHSNLERMARLAVGRRAAGAAGRAARAYARRLYRRFDRVLAPSESKRRHLRDRGVDTALCQPLGVDTQRFHPGRSSAAWRAAQGFPAGTRLLVYAGRFAAEKHLDVLAAAVARLGPPYALLAIGAGPTPPRGPGVRVLPFLADAGALATALASADAFVHAGDQETFGLSLLEAFACGTPAVVRRAEGLAELIDGSVGVGVDSGDADAFAAAIEALCSADRAALSRAARARAEAHDWERVLPGLLAQYRSLLRGADERAPDPGVAGAPTVHAP